MSLSLMSSWWYILISFFISIVFITLLLVLIKWWFCKNKSLFSSLRFFQTQVDHLFEIKSITFFLLAWIAWMVLKMALLFEFKLGSRHFITWNHYFLWSNKTSTSVLPLFCFLIKIVVCLLLLFTFICFKIKFYYSLKYYGLHIKYYVSNKETYKIIKWNKQK